MGCFEMIAPLTTKERASRGGSCRAVGRVISLQPLGTIRDRPLSQTLPSNPLQLCSVRTPVIWTDGHPLCLPLAARMEGALRPSLLLLLLVLQPGGSGRAGAGATELSRIVGDSVTFPLGIPAEQVTAVVWTVNTRSVVSVRAGTPPVFIVLDPPYEGRLRVPESNSLQITSLRMQDTGTYKAQISTVTGTSTILGPFPLRVYKHVPEPTVLCDSATYVNETCNYNLRCTVWDGGDNVTYSWTHTAGGPMVPSGSVLHISLRPRDAPLNVTCTAQNPVSNSSTTASAKGLCAANQPESQSARTAGIAVPIVIVIFGLIIIALCFVHTQRCKRAFHYAPRSAGGKAPGSRH